MNLTVLTYETQLTGSIKNARERALKMLQETTSAVTAGWER